MSVQKLHAVEQVTRVPFMDLAALHAPIQKEIEHEISKLASSSSFVLGPSVERFENNFAEYCEAEYAVGCNSGTSAIHMALRALDIGPGDEIITVSHTFIGTVWGILYCGASPVFVDIDPNTMNMDVARIEAQITERTRAIIPVHLYGQPVDMDPLLDIAHRHGLAVVEDAAQAHGARYKGRRVGSLADMACFSFYPGKNLGAWGEAGAVVTSSPDMAERLRRIRDHGQPRRYSHTELGFNYRMDAFQGAVLDVKLKYLDVWNCRRTELAAVYHRQLANISDLHMPGYAIDIDPVHHLFVVRHSRRDQLLATLQTHGIDAGLHYPVPVHRQPALAAADCTTELPVTDAVAGSCLSLPLHPAMTDAQAMHVCSVLAADPALH